MKENEVFGKRGDVMVTTKKIKNSSLYENMIKTEKKAYEAQDELLAAIKKWFSKVISEESADFTKIILGHGGYIQIRTVEELNENVITNFKMDFDFELTWIKVEKMTDFRNVETISVDIYEYGFIPRNIKELLGDNQVELGQDVID